MPPTTVRRAQGDVRDSQADTTAARRDLGHDPQYSLEDGLRRTLAWYRATAASCLTSFATPFAKFRKARVSTYGDVARAAGFPGCARQVVWALRGASRGLPWHRVVGAGGKISLPGENGLEQRFRLEAEGVVFHGARVWMEKHQHELAGAAASGPIPSRKKSKTVS